MVFACGNPSRGDDALGPLLLEKLQSRYAGDPRIELIDDFQLQIEHALDLADCGLALFIDAGMACAVPFSFSRLTAQAKSCYTTHAMHPAGVLAVYRETHQQVPPPAFLLSVRGYEFGLGEPLSAKGQAHFNAAMKFLSQLCGRLSVTAWTSLADKTGPKPC